MLPPLNRVIVLCTLCSFFFSIYYVHAHNKINSSNVSVLSDSLLTAKQLKFEKKYNSLLSRAYFKLIVEAERADINLGKEYKELYYAFESNTMSSDAEAEFFKVYEKFMSHRRMLNGLKSWRIFSDFRTGDLEYFKAENYDQILKMYRRGSNDFTMVKVLMYRLADLYHFGE